jgi:hypothetical protein
MISNEEEFHAEKARLQVEAAAANKRFEDAQSKKQQLILDTHLESAYAESGGISTDSEAYQAIKNHLKIELQDGEIVIKDKWGEIERNADGTAKSVRQKMTELKRTETFKGFFSSGDSSPQDGNSSQQENQTQTYTREQARAGKVNIADIASGKIQLESTQPSIRPDAKVVDADKVANLKKRRWK